MSENTKDTKPEETSIYEYLEIGSDAIGFILLSCGIIYLLATMNSMGYFTNTRHGLWFFIDALIAFASIALGGLMFLVANDFKRIKLDKKYPKLKK